MNQHERMSQMFATIDAEGRRYVLAVLQGEYDRVQESPRPALRLLAGAVGSPPVGQAPSTSEKQLLAAFRAADDDSQQDCLAMVSAVAQRFPRQRPVLTLVAVRRRGGAR
jgi:hypothetical protein